MSNGIKSFMICDDKLCDKCKVNKSAFKLGHESEFRLCKECMDKWMKFHSVNPYAQQMNAVYDTPLFHDVWYEIFFAFLGKVIPEKVQFT